MKSLEEVQNLIGQAKGAYMNDRAPDRWTKVVQPLEKAFDIIVSIRD